MWATPVTVVVATANVRGSLGPEDARSCVRRVIEYGPDVVALQEWHPGRRRILRDFEDYDWFCPLVGGCVVGTASRRFEVVARRAVPLSGLGLADRHGWLLGLEPPRRAAIVIARDRDEGQDLAAISFHLVSQVQARDEYRLTDRPRLVARHQREAAALNSLVSRTTVPTYAAGDSNFHGFRIPGLESAWGAAPDNSGTLGARRRVDDIFAPAAPDRVELVATRSDHRAVVATYGA